MRGMNAQEFHDEILRPSLELILPVLEIGDRPEATRMLMAIAGQESGWSHRYQLAGPMSSTKAGPARGWWQFEMRGGVAGVMGHRLTQAKAKRLCDLCHVYFDEDDIWRALEGHDALATGFARLLLWTEPRPLPTDREGGWSQYFRNWRPGKPHPEKWPDVWSAAHSAVVRRG